jgi:hypothetical protein
MRRQFVTLVGLALAGMAGASLAAGQNLEMANPPSTQAGTATVPIRGMSMAGVENSFGAPAERFAAVGQPPISRWVYPGFVVYFEYDHVVHAVATPAR